MEFPFNARYNPREEVSKHVQFQWVFLSGERQMVEYKCVLWHYFRKWLVGKLSWPPRSRGWSCFPTQHLCSRFKSSFITKNHHTCDFWLLIPHKQNPYTEINQPAVTAKISSHSGIQLCVASVTDKSWHTDFHGLNEKLPWLVPSRTHLNTDHTYDSPKIRKIFQLRYVTLNKWPSQQMCKYSATDGIALCLHAVQQCGCKIIQRNGSDVSDNSDTLSDKNCN
jgi:hypothetical protein